MRKNINRTNLSLIIELLHFILLMSIFIPSFMAVYYKTSDSYCVDIVSLNNFLKFGPNDNLFFIGKKIDTWDAWISYMFLFTLKQGFSSASAEITSAWFVNQLADPKVNLNPAISYINVQLFYFNWSLDNTLTIFTSLTQIDFLLASIIGSFVITLMTTYYYLKEKNKKELTKEEIELERLLSI